MTEIPRIVTTDEYALALGELLDALDRMHGELILSANVQEARSKARLLVPAKPKRIAKKDRVQQ